MLFQKLDYWIHECKKCKHHFTHLKATHEHTQKIYDDDYFFGGGDGYPDYLSGANLLVAHGRRYGKLLKQYLQPGTVLDVGAAAGFILKGLADAGWKGEGIEPNARLAEYACKELGLAVRAGTLEQFKTDARYDVVTMIQVAAHFYNVRSAFQVAAELTRPGGYWLIETSNKDSLVARVMGKNWHLYSPPSVLNFFTPETLNKLAQQYGFREVARGRPSKWLKGNHVKSLVSHKLQGSRLERPGNILWKAFPDEVSVPYPSFDLFWGLYRKH